MNLVDYEKYYHSGSEFIIPRDEFEKIIEENQRLNNVLNKYKNYLIKKMNEFVSYDGDLSKIYEEEFDYFYELNELKESDK